MSAAIVLEDNAAAGVDVRRKHMPEHLAFLQRNAATIQAAGPLAEADGQGAGGLWLVEAKDPSAVDALVGRSVLADRLAQVGANLDLESGFR